MSEFAGELTALIRSLSKDAMDPDDGEVTPLWSQIQELGLTGIGIAESAGGSGGELADLVVVIRELARAGIGSPIVEASTAAFAIGPASAGFFDTVTTNPVVLLRVPELTADLGIVAFASRAAKVVIIGEDDVAVVNLSDAIVEPVIDIAGRPAGRVRVDRARRELCGIERGAVAERLALARTAALVGNCWGAYELTKRYVLERHQFGAPLIRIPAVSTSLAQMAVRIRAAESSLHRAVEVCSVGAESAEVRRFGAVAGARVVAAQAATLVARSTHQLHGAVGITREYGLHRYTLALWSQRDADHSQRDWSERLGATAIAFDEGTLWEQMTA